MDGHAEGSGVYKYADGDIHEGEFHNGKKHGKGRFTLGDGTMEITGMWLFDDRVGDIPNEDGTTGDNKENMDNDGKDSDDDDDFLPPGFKPPTEEELREQLDCAQSVEEQINVSRQLMALRPGLKIKLKPLAEVVVEKEKAEGKK